MNEPIQCPKCKFEYFTRVHRVTETNIVDHGGDALHKLEENKQQNGSYARMRNDTPRFQCARCGAIVAIWEGGNMLDLSALRGSNAAMP